MYSQMESLALLKSRVYRFSDDDETHIAAECIEDMHQAGRYLADQTVELAQQQLASFDRGPELSFFQPEVISQLEQLDLAKEAAARQEFAKRQIPSCGLDRVICIVGSPRSGSSLLFNLLVFQGCFSYFTNLSHHCWASYNLRRTKSIPFNKCDAEMFTIDTRRLKLMSGMLLPAECEYIFHRAFSTYQHLATHSYGLHAAYPVNPDVLTNSIRHHVDFFQESDLLCKSPFNSFRMESLASLLGENCVFIHIVRNGYDTSLSIAENGFRYKLPSRCAEFANSRESWRHFVRSVLEYPKQDRVLTVRFEELLDDCHRQMRRISEWLDIQLDPSRIPHIGKKHVRGHSTLGIPCKLVDELNSQLGYCP
jgi:hypothetical protein